MWGACCGRTGCTRLGLSGRRGRSPAEELRAVEDRAVREAVALQQEVGLQSVTDGEFRRATWHMDFVYQIGGISKAPGSLLSTFHNEGGDITFTPDAIRVDRRVSMDKTIFGEDFAFLQSIAGDVSPEADDPGAVDGALPVGHPGRRGRVRLPGCRASSGPTCPPPTPRRSAGSPPRAARTCSSTTRRWRT